MPINNPMTRMLSTRDSWELRHYLVIFFDLLGQREQLRNLTALPTDREEYERVVATLKNTVGRVINLRVAFESFFEGMRTETDFSKGLPEADRLRLRDHSQDNLEYFAFSDSFLVSVPIDNTNEHCTTMNGVHRALSSACSVMIVALNAGIALRGGVDVGLGMELCERQIYGPCLERAHYLESRIADFPRIAVGGELPKYLQSVAGQAAKTTYGHCAIALANQCSGLIFEDSDGTRALDYFGAGFRRSAGEGLDRNLLQGALDFSETEFKRWTNAGNAKHADRHSQLMTYLRSRANLWE